MFLGSRNAVGLGVGGNPSIGTTLRKSPAALSLDFLTGSASIDPQITFTRASTATYVNSSGLITSSAINTPRIDYDPVTLACKGLLIEEQRTNLLTYSEQFDNAAWSLSNATITPNATTAPDGTITADKLITSAAVTSGQIVGTTSVTANTVYSFSVYAKVGEYGWVYPTIRGLDGSDDGAYFNLITGAIGSVDTNVTASISGPYNGYYRCSISKNTNSGASTGRQRIYVASGNGIRPTGNGTSGIYIWGAQLEAGAFPTSYIPTTSAQVTRSADVATMTGTNFSSWYNQSEGTLYGESVLSRQNAAGGTGIVTIDDSTVLNSTGLFYRASGATGANIQLAGVTQFDAVPTSAIAANAVLKFVIAYKSNDCAASGNGGAVSTGVGSIPTVNRLEIGYRPSSAYLNGHIRRITYFPRRLANSELQALTS